MSLTSFIEMRGPLVSHSSNTQSFLLSHLLARSMSFCSISSLFSGEFVQIDPVIVEPINEISSQRTVEDILRQFCMRRVLPI